MSLCSLYTERLYAERHYAECHYAECHYAERHYAECHYAESRGTSNAKQGVEFVNVFFSKESMKRANNSF